MSYVYYVAHYGEALEKKKDINVKPSYPSFQNKCLFLVRPLGPQRGRRDICEFLILVGSCLSP